MASRFQMDVEFSNLSFEFSQLSLKDTNEFSNLSIDFSHPSLKNGLGKNDTLYKESKAIEGIKDKGPYIVSSFEKASPLACNLINPFESHHSKVKKNRKIVLKCDHLI